MDTYEVVNRDCTSVLESDLEKLICATKMSAFGKTAHAPPYANVLLKFSVGPGPYYLTLLKALLTLSLYTLAPSPTS